LHEFKRGKLKSGSGGKVTSRQQALAIGLSQARRAGYKVPSQHASMSLDTRVRAYLNNMQPGTKVDARGVARALGGVDPLETDYALERAERAGLASTSDGRWFGPVSQQTGHARKKQLDLEVDAILAQGPRSEIKLKDRHSGGHVWLTIRGDRVVGVMGADPKRYMGMTLDEAKHHARYGGHGSFHRRYPRGRLWHGSDAGTPSSHATKKRKARLVHVRAETPAGYRWLLAHVRGATATPEGFAVTDEEEWAQSLAAAGAFELR
jgi:hypothetical protein